MSGRKCSLCWAHDGTHNPDCMSCEGTGYRPMEDAIVNESDNVKVRENGTGFIAYFADRPINGPYGAGNTPDEARASLTAWMRENRLKEAQDAILTMRFLAANSPDPIAASTADGVAQVLEWAIGGKNDEFEAMIRQTKAEIAAVKGPLGYVTDLNYQTINRAERFAARTETPTVTPLDFGVCGYCGGPLNREYSCRNQCARNGRD